MSCSVIGCTMTNAMQAQQPQVQTQDASAFDTGSCSMREFGIFFYAIMTAALWTSSSK